MGSGWVSLVLVQVQVPHPRTWVARGFWARGEVYRTGRATLGLLGAGDENRTHVSSLGSSCSTIELHPRGGIVAERIVPVRAALAKREWAQDHSMRFFSPGSGWARLRLRSARGMPLASTRTVTQPLGRSLLNT